MVWRAAQLCLYFHSDRSLPLYDVLIVKWRQKMRALFGTKCLGRAQCGIKVVSNQLYRDKCTTKHPGFLNFLLGRGHRHEDHACHSEMATHERNALRMIAGTRAHKNRPFGDHFAHRVERATQFIGPHRAQILALEPYIRAKPLRQVIIPQ